MFGSVFVLEVETAAQQGNIRSPEDAVWWTWVTLCTVGYGDKYPVTLPGRIMGAVLMTVGITVFGTLAGLLSSFFIRVCTLPRNSTRRRSGRRKLSCARRRKDDDPTVAPCGRSSIEANRGDTKPSRTSARGK